MSKPRSKASSEPINADDDEDNPPWWGREWDASQEYESKLLSDGFQPRADILDLSHRSAMIDYETERTPEQLEVCGMDLTSVRMLEARDWGEAARDAWHKGDVAFFEQCARYLAIIAGERDGKTRKNDVPLAVTIIKTARELAFLYRRHPTKMEVQEAVEKLTDNDGNPLVGGGFRWEWARWHLSFLLGKSDVTK